MSGGETSKQQNGNTIRVVLACSLQRLDTSRVALQFARILYDRARAEETQPWAEPGSASGPEAHVPCP